MPEPSVEPIPFDFSELRPAAPRRGAGRVVFGGVGEDGEFFTEGNGGHEFMLCSFPGQALKI